MATIEQLLARCPAAAGSPLDGCPWCGEPGRGFCSARCRTAAEVNHRPSRARMRRMLTDGYRCVRCGAGPGARVLDAIEEERRRVSELGAGHPMTAEAEVERARLVADASKVLHVDHVRPVRGRRGSGCQHHQDNLRTLCHDCHRRMTAESRRRDWGTVDPHDVDRFEQGQLIA